MLSEYEKTKQANIARNRDLLNSLGLDKPLFEKEKPTKKPVKSKKRKEPQQSEDGTTDEENDEKPAAKIQRFEAVSSATDSNVRRSSRNAGKVVDYKKEIQRGSLVPIAYSSGVKTAGNEGPMGREGGSRRIHNPKTFGSIPGIAVGTWWETRQGCSDDAIHAPWVGGISGGSEGAHSVVISGGYEDDVDLGYAFTYTGSGGRNLKGTKNAPKNLRTAPQSSDQTFENNFNRMLQRSSETRKPVRVVRGFKSSSKWAPSEGYRYDGLYMVEKAWLEKGLNPKGYLVCKFAFKRIPNQPPLIVRNKEGGDDEANSNSDADDSGEDAEGSENDEDDIEAKPETS